MLGKITLDKSSMVMSYFLYTIWVINENGGRIDRSSFEKKMASLIGLPIFNEDGSVNRTPYNKSKFPRYFGFVESLYDDDKNEFLCLTRRGCELSKIIGENLEKEADERYFLTNKEAFSKLIFYSLLFDSFGKNNCGAEQSNTDIEPPKFVFKVLQELGSATANEIYYALFGMNGYPSKSKKPLFATFEDAIESIRKNRTTHQSYDSWIESWELRNHVTDCKIVKILGPKGFDLITSSLNPHTNELEYSVSKSLSKECLEYVQMLKPFYQPLFHIQESAGCLEDLQEWMNVAVYGKYSSDRYIFKLDVKKFSGDILNNPVFCSALKTAFSSPNDSVFLEFTNAGYNDVLKMFEGYTELLNRIDNVQDDLNGWSEKAVEAPSLYIDIKSSADKKTINVLAKNTIRLPSNLNITGVVSNAN